MPAALERRAGCRLPAQPPWQQCQPAVRLRPPEAPSGYAPSAPPPAASRTPERSTPTHSSALSGAAKAEHAGSQHLARSRKCLDTRGGPCRQSTVDAKRSPAYDAGMWSSTCPLVIKMTSALHPSCKGVPLLAGPECAAVAAKTAPPMETDLLHAATPL